MLEHDCPAVLQIKEGTEPPMFTAYFMAWDTTVKVRTTADYDKRVAELKAQQAAGAAAAAEESKPSWAQPDADAPADDAPAGDAPVECAPSSSCPVCGMLL